MTLTRKAKLWESTRSCHRHSAVNSRKGAKGAKNQKTTFSQEILNAISSITQKPQPLISTKQKGTQVI